MKQLKLIGIELVRGLSIYAVILVHSGDETWQKPVDIDTIPFRSLFYFATPFFLATAFHFMTNKAENVNLRKFWQSKIKRILFPYLIWSGIFFVFKVINFRNNPERLHHLVQDPLSIIFFGGASYHLYFLPMMFTGMFLVMTMPLLQKLKIDKIGLILLGILSIVLYSLLEASGNGFSLGDTNTAFRSIADNFKIDIEKYPLLRFCFVETAWIVKCLPYFLIALIINKLNLPQKVLNADNNIIVMLTVAFVCFDTFGTRFLPAGLAELLLAFTLLLFGIAISKHSTNSTINDLIDSVGVSSFGIYLVHPFIMYFTKFSIDKAYPQLLNSVSISSILILSITSFFLSWCAVAFLGKREFKTSYLFGM
jgi:peptidoglycan/LPS O-acetylase OafA/YrhL